jgi:diguanylate cyclase (GGDEF)-like protein
MDRETFLENISLYLNSKAMLLFLVLDRQGTICRMNRFAAKIIGQQRTGNPFKQAVVDFSRRFDFSRAVENSDMEHLLNIKTVEGATQTYHFYFYNSGKQILAFGHLDVDGIESLSQELVSANQELNNLMRQLYMKNQELERANEKITELTRTDPLTQLANRRYFDERIKEMYSLARRKSQPLSLVMTDIDKFKRVNDTFGHDAGDRVLVGYADMMKKTLRSEDLAARFGGEEFIILLPLTTLHQARVLAERIRTEIARHDFLENGHSVTASFGVSQLAADETIQQFIKRADSALYQAKESGRNQTVLAS